MSDPSKPTPPAPTRTQLATAPTVLISPKAGSAGTRRPLAPRTRLQRFFSIDNLRDIGGTLLIVVPLTLVIWIWAEREQVDKQTFSVSLKASSSADQIARIINPNVSILLEGPKSGLDAFDRALRDSGREITITLPRANVASREVASLMNVSELLADQRLIRDLGLTIRNSPTVDVVIDQLVERAIDIRKPEELRLLEMTADPVNVTVKGPRRALQDLPDGAHAEIIPPNPAELAAMTTPGAKRTITDVQLRLVGVPDDRAITLTRQTIASATFVVPLSLEDRATINYSLSIRLDWPDVITTGRIQGINVVGPRDVVGKLDTEEVKRQIFARITLSRDDVIELGDGKTLERVPEIILPPNVRFEGTIPPVKVSAPEGGTSDVR
jgi:hypothetical protein